MSEAAAARALGLWPVAVQSCVIAAQRENVVWRVVASDGAAYALRFHRPGYRSEAEIGSELAWMAELAARGLEVPRPLPSRRGELIELCGKFQVDLLTWLGGRPLGKVGQRLDIADRAAVFSGLGAAMARLHAISDRWRAPLGFVRPRWDADGLTGDHPLWGPFWENPALDEAAKALLIAARDKVRTVLAQHGAMLDFGLIHADLVRENVLVDGQHIRMIDFDDSGFGYRLFDVATALLKNRDEPDYAELEAALIAGYRRHRDLDVRLLPLFLMLRAFTYLGWIIPRLGESDAPARNLRNIGPALALARAYVDKN